MGSIPTSGQWKVLRQDEYKLPEGVGPSLGAALEKYHKAKKLKGAESAIKALEAAKKVATEFRTSKKVFEYYVEKNIPEQHDRLRGYLAQLIKDMDARVIKLRRYIVLEKDIGTITVEDVLTNRKLLNALLELMKKEFSTENYRFLVAYEKEGFTDGKSNVAAAMAFLDQFDLGDLNIPNSSKLQALRNREDDLLADERRKELGLWKQLYGELALAYKEIKKNLHRDLIPRMMNGKEGRKIMIKHVGGEKALNDYLKTINEK